jgi:hypothetical protein
MGIVMGDSAGERAESWMMGSANASDHGAKVLRGYDRPRGMEECHLIVKPFSDVIELRG